MGRGYTEFECAVIASIVWQIKGFQGHQVPRSATSRILRASLRRISPVLIGRSSAITSDSIVEVDHAIPVSVISDILLVIDDVSDLNVKHVLNKYLVSAELTQEEHRIKLKGCAGNMPEGWKFEGDAPENLLARYIEKGIRVDAISSFENDRVVGFGKFEGDDLISEACEDGDFKRFPLRKFYLFARQNNLVEESSDIENFSVPQNVISRGSTLRRGQAVFLLEQESLLDDFIKECWQFGFSEKGRSEIARCKKFARAVLNCG